MPTVREALLRTSRLAQDVAAALGPDAQRGALGARANQYAAFAAVEWDNDDGEIAAIGCAFDLQSAVAAAAAERGGAYVPLEEWVATLVGRNRGDRPARRLSESDPSHVFAEGTGALGALNDELQRIGAQPGVEPELQAWASAVGHGSTTTVEMVAQVLEAQAAGHSVPPPADVLAELVAVTAYTASMALIGLLYTEPAVAVADEDREHLIDLSRRAGTWAVATANPPLS